MVEKSPEGDRRASVGMYDPARDIWDRSGERDQARSEQLHRAPEEPLSAASSPLVKSEAQPRNESQAHRIAEDLPSNDPLLKSERGAQDPVPTILPQNHSEHPRATPEQYRPQSSPTATLPTEPLAAGILNSGEAPTRSSKPVSKALALPQTKDSNAKPAISRTMDTQYSAEASPLARESTEVDPERNGTNASPGMAHDQNGSPTEKKRKTTEEETAAENQRSGTDCPISKRKRLEERHQKLRKRGRTPPSAYSRRDRSRSPTDQSAQRDRRRSPSPLPPRRSPTPEEQSRQRKRPGGGARMGIVDRETLRRRQEERERAQEADAQRALRDRGVADVVRQHYNAVPERGRDWRRTESKIKGLRSFNNWIKSTLIQKFSPDEEFLSRHTGSKNWADDTAPPQTEEKRLLVVDLGCGKGGDLGKWQQAPQPVDLYVGLDPAEISIDQARDRYNAMRSGRGPRGRGRHPLFHAEFWPKDCFGEWLGDVRIVQQVGIDPNVGPGGSVMSSRWGGGGFDVVATMFTMHYAFESEEKTRQMLRNVAGSLKKGGRFLGVGPNSDVISAKVVEFHKKRKERQAVKKEEAEAPEDGEVEEDENFPEWGNSIYRVKFHGPTPEDGVFRPPFGWKYSYFMQEAVEEVPEYVVPWEAFRALTEDYNLELQYRKPFLEVWRDEKDDPELGPLSERMGVRERGGGPLLMTEEEKEAASFYHAFCFYKV